MRHPTDGKAAAPVTWPQVHAFRASRHHLDRQAHGDALATVVGDSCGLQAQVMAAARLAARVRVRGITIEEIDRALWRTRSIVRGWCMRGTVHLVPAKELAVFVRGNPRPAQRWTTWLDHAGIPRAAVDRLVEAASKAMDRPRTRDEIATRIRDSLGIPIEKRASRGWGSPSNAPGFRVAGLVLSVPSLAFLASYQARACFGPDEGDGTTFVRPDAWIRSWRDVSVEHAEQALVRRYLGSFGPATPGDYQAWSALMVKDVRRIWASLEEELAPVDVEGRSAWILRRDLASLERAHFDRRNVRLLPYFDSYLMGHKDREHLVKRSHHKKIYRPQGWVYPAVLVDGHVAGEWAHERKGGRLHVRVRPYEPLDAETKDLVRDEADDVGRFLGDFKVRLSFEKSG